MQEVYPSNDCLWWKGLLEEDCNDPLRAQCNNTVQHSTTEYKQSKLIQCVIWNVLLAVLHYILILSFIPPFALFDKQELNHFYCQKQAYHRKTANSICTPSLHRLHIYYIYRMKKAERLYVCLCAAPSPFLHYTTVQQFRYNSGKMVKKWLKNGGEMLEIA